MEGVLMRERGDSRVKRPWKFLGIVIFTKTFPTRFGRIRLGATISRQLFLSSRETFPHEPIGSENKGKPVSAVLARAVFLEKMLISRNVLEISQHELSYGDRDLWPIFPATFSRYFKSRETFLLRYITCRSRGRFIAREFSRNNFLSPRRAYWNSSKQF